MILGLAFGIWVPNLVGIERGSLWDWLLAGLIFFSVFAFSTYVGRLIVEDRQRKRLERLRQEAEWRREHGP